MSIDKIIATLPEKSLEDCGKMRNNAQRLLTTGTAVQRADAERLLAALAQMEQPADSTPYDQLSESEIVRRVGQAMVKLPLTEAEAKSIQVLLDHPNSSSPQLSAICGWNGMIWQTQFGGLCHRRLIWLWPTGPVEAWGKPFYSGLFATFDRNGSLFTMRPAVAAALAAIGIVARKG